MGVCLGEHTRYGHTAVSVHISAVPVYGGCGEMFLESITQGTGS